MVYKRYSPGKIEVITGPMFSGKTEELIKRVFQVSYAKMKYLVFKPEIDNRWGKDKITSRAGASINAIPIKDSKEILNYVDPSIEVIAIDEAQFFDKEIINIITLLANKGIRVIVSALDQDFEGKPFRHIPELLAIAEIVSKQTAICFKCGKDATMSFRLNKNGPQIQIGDREYEARCRKCHFEENN